MKWKLWLRNLSVAAPRVAVRTQLPWTVRAGLGVLTCAIAAAAVAMVYQHARARGAPDREEVVRELETVRGQFQQAAGERERFAARAVQAENQLKVERALQEQLTLQLKGLEAENARLKGDLAFFESLLPTQASARGVVIRSFKLQPDVDDNVIRYRLLVQQSGRPERDFVGQVSLRVNLQQDGRSSTLELPDAAQPAAGPAPLAFRHYQRVEGTFSVPAGTSVRSVQVTINAGGETRAQQTFAM